MSRKHVDTIDIIGCNGDFCRISPPGFSWGPELAAGSKGLFDLPIQTNYGNYAYGQYFQSWKPKLRTPVWTVHLMNPETGTRLDQSEYLFHLIYARWKAMFSPKDEATVVYTSVDGPRTLGLRTFQGDQSFSTQNFEGIDPHIFSYGSIVQTMAAELPFYVGIPIEHEIQFDGTGNFWARMPYYNAASIETFVEWDVTWGAQYQLPDYSFGNDVFGRALSDAGKTVLTPTIVAGDGNVNINTRPNMETYISEWGTPVDLRAGGRKFKYPIPPGKGDTEAGCVVRALNVIDGAAIKLRIPQWFDSPFSTPRVF